MNSYHLAIDIGAGSGRAVAGRIEQGKYVSINELHRFSTQRINVNGHLLINVDTWSTDFGILDKSGKLIGLPFFYRDKRTEGTAEIVDKKVGREQLHYWTGGRFDPCSTLHQIVSMVRDSDNALLTGNVMLFLGDLLNYFLTGKCKSEYSVASYSQMYNMKENRWENRIFDSLEIPTKLQPEVIKPGTIVGQLNPDIIQQTGLLGSPVVIAPAIHDTASAALAIPAAGNNVFISSGTWSLIGMVLDEPIINQSTYEAQFSSTGMGFNKVLFKKNIAGFWIFQECIRNWRKEGLKATYDEIDKLAENAEPHTAYIDSDDPVFYRPQNMLSAIQEYLEKTGQIKVDKNDVGQLIRIIYESMSMKYNYSLEQMRSICKKPFERISIVGGGSKIDLINKFTASVTGLPVYAGPDEASSLGNLLMQAYGMDELSSEKEIRVVVKNSCSIKEYIPEDTAAWKGAYKQYCKKIKPD